MKQTDAAWIAGFLDGNGFQVNINRGRSRGKKVFRAPSLLIMTVKEDRLETLDRLCKLTGGSLSRSGKGHTFGERFDHEGRPAQYVDGSAAYRYQFFLSCSKIQELYPLIDPYLSIESAAKLLPVMEYDLDNAKSQAGKKGNESIRRGIYEAHKQRA